MKISDILSSQKTTLSLEVFPPKNNSNFESMEEAIRQIARLSPDFMSVTYGAGGGTSAHTVRIASEISSTGVSALAHLSCISSDRETIVNQLEQLKAMSIENVLALRGDKPENYDESAASFHHANELVSLIKELYPEFCVGGACYPEGHPESPDWKTDVLNLKRKVDSGCDFLTTQMFFDNGLFYSFLNRIHDAGITVPVIAGIMPITNEKQVARTIKLSSAFMPIRFRSLVDHYGSDPQAMKQAGIIYATDQIIDLLANGIKHIHIYTMNKPDVSEAIMNNLAHLL